MYVVSRFATRLPSADFVVMLGLPEGCHLAIISCAVRALLPFEVKTDVCWRLRLRRLIIEIESIPSIAQCYISAIVLSNKLLNLLKTTDP